MKLRLSFLVTSVLVAGLTTVTFAGSPKITLKLSGSSTVLPVAVKAAENFMKTHPDIKITVNPGGSGVGVKSIGNSLVDIGMASREVSEKEIKNFSDVKFVTHVIGRDAVACVISSEIYYSGVKSLSKMQIKKIYQGKIDNWKGVGGPDKEIFVIDKERHRGTRHVFMAYVFGNKTAKAMGADLVSGSNNEEQTKVALSNTAIGMLSNAWLNDDVKGVGINEDGKIIEPSIKNIKNGSYPIARNLNFLTNGNSKKNSAVINEFIEYVMSPEGQAIVKASGYVAVK